VVSFPWLISSNYGRSPGKMFKKASSQIEATAGENLKTAKGLPDYGKVSAILIGVSHIFRDSGSILTSVCQK
jgi:hypothetical protein